MNRLFDAKEASFEDLPISLVTGFVRNGQCVLPGVDRGADILASPLGAHQPPLVEQGHVSSRVDLAHNVEAPSREGQSLGVEVRDQAAQFGGQPWNGSSTSF